MKKLLHKLLRDRRGISMTEVIVAMAMVTIVTGAAISVVMASIKFDVKYNERTAALSYCESVVDCVRFAGNQDELNAALVTLGFPRLEQEGVLPTSSLTVGGSVIKITAGTVLDTELVNYVVTCDDDEIYAITKPKT